MCACGHYRHNGRCLGLDETWIEKGLVSTKPCECSAWVTPIPNVDTTATRAVQRTDRTECKLHRIIYDVDAPCMGCEQGWSEKPLHDPVSAPAHYTWHPDGIQQIQVSEHLSFNLGAAVKYIWRAGRKGDAIEDLRKAAWHINREIERLGGKK